MILNPTNFLTTIQTAIAALHTLNDQLYRECEGIKYNDEDQNLVIPHRPGYEFATEFDLIVRVDNPHVAWAAAQSLSDELSTWRHRSGDESDLKKILIIPQAPLADGAADSIMKRVTELEPECEVVILDMLEDEYDGYEAIKTWHPAKWVKALLRAGLIREIPHAPKARISMAELSQELTDAPRPYYHRKRRKR